MYVKRIQLEVQLQSRPSANRPLRFFPRGLRRHLSHGERLTPRDWTNSLACVVQEIRAICDYGVTNSEMKRYMSAMLKDVEKGVVENDTVPSEDHLNFIMTSDVFNPHCDAPRTVLLKRSRSSLKKSRRTTCSRQPSGSSVSSAIMVLLLRRRPLLWWCAHPRGFVTMAACGTDFVITEEEVVKLLLSVPDKTQEEALNQVEVPNSLLKGQVEMIGAQLVDSFHAWRAANRQYRFRHWRSAAQAAQWCTCQLRELFGSAGGRFDCSCLAAMPRDVDPSASRLGVRTVSEAGAVSDFSREQIELFAVSNLISVHLDLDYEFSYVDASFSREGLHAVLELMRLLFTEPRWELPAFIRSQQAYKAQASAMKKSLEQSTLNRMMRMMYPSDKRVGEPEVEDLSKLTLAKVRDAISSQMRPQDMEINLVVDLDSSSPKG